MRNNRFSPKIINHDLVIIEKIAPKIAGLTAEQSTLLVLVEKFRSNSEVNIKFLETFYSGSRSSFQLFIKKLVDTRVIDLDINPLDRRSKIVRFTPKIQDILNLYFNKQRRKSTNSSSCYDYCKKKFCSRYDSDACATCSEICLFSTNQESCLDAAATIWHTISVKDQLPTLTVDRIIDFSSVFDLRRAHIVETVGQAADDFRYCRIGNVGRCEARVMRGNLLSTLPDCEYKQQIYGDYNLSLIDKIPVFRNVNTSNSIIRAEYDRLVLPFKGDGGSSMKLLVLIGQIINLD